MQTLMNDLFNVLEKHGIVEEDSKKKSSHEGCCHKDCCCHRHRKACHHVEVVNWPKIAMCMKRNNTRTWMICRIQDEESYLGHHDIWKGNGKTTKVIIPRTEMDLSVLLKMQAMMLLGYYPVPMGGESFTIESQSGVLLRDGTFTQDRMRPNIGVRYFHNLRECCEWVVGENQ